MDLIRTIFRIFGVYVVATVVAVIFIGFYDGLATSTGFVHTEMYESVTFWVKTLFIAAVVGGLMILVDTPKNGDK